MVMAMWEREVAAEALAKWTSSIVLTTTYSTLTTTEPSTLLDVGPWSSDLTSIASLGKHSPSIETHILRRQRYHLCCIGGNAHAI